MADPLIMRVRKALAAVKTPSGDGNIVGAGMVTGLSAENGAVRFALEFPPDAAPDPQVLEAARTAAASIKGVEKVSAVATAHSPAPAKSAAPRRTSHDNPFGLGAKKRERTDAPLLPGVKKVIAIASGKGGVGKSTVAANLAVALARAGLKVGLLDADIYGPSAPTLFGLAGQADIVEGRIQPAQAHGVALMSIGLLVKPEQALAWRGPMVMGAIRQLLNDVDWGELDILLIDTPPGTGDAHLSLIQTKRLDGAVIVSTPQEMALADVRRGVNLFEKTETRLIGVIENMAWLEGADGARQYLFGDAGAEKAARDLGAPFLGAIPLYPDLRIASDEGAPLAAQDHPGAVQFSELARAIRDRL